MPRVQCIVVRGNRVLMVKHRQDGVEWWCLPGGGQEPGETAQEGALRELAEECRLTGTIVRQTSYLCYGPEDTTVSFLVQVGDQQPSLGFDPEVEAGHEIMVDVQWLQLSEIPERDRAFLWAAGLLGIDTFFKEVEAWGDDPSYPKQNR